MAFLLKVRSLFLSGLLSILLLVAVQEAARAEPVLTTYYGEELAGNPTASGEPFDPYGLTAAHPYLPFGTPLTVTYNGRSVNVRVNDRGPFVPGRGLDLSLGAARDIGLTDSGPAVVEMETGVEAEADQTPEVAPLPEAEPSPEAESPAKPSPEAESPVPQRETKEPARPTHTHSSAKKPVSLAGMLEARKHHLLPLSGTLIPVGNRVADSMGRDSSPEPRKVDVHYGITSSPWALTMKLVEETGEQVAQTLYGLPTDLRRKSSEPGEEGIA